jgi:hypothetical protein
LSTSVELKRLVVVKVIMTQAFRDQMTREAQDTLKRLQENLAAIEGAALPQLETLKGTEPEQAAQLGERLEVERQRVQQAKSQLDWRVRELEGVQEGAELPFRTFEGPVTLTVGDDFLKKMANTEIVLKDWEVVEIRQS